MHHLYLGFPQVIGDAMGTVACIEYGLYMRGVCHLYVMVISRVCSAIPLRADSGSGWQVAFISLLSKPGI